MHRFTFLFAALLALGACGGSTRHRVTSTGPNFKRATTFTPAEKVTGSRLATDRVVKIEGDHELTLNSVGGRRLGVLTVRVEAGLQTSAQQCLTESTVWPGASVDAAALGATHARMISIAAPPCCCDLRSSRSTSLAMPQINASYELWHVEPDRWPDLPEHLRPKPVPASAIRDVQPGNWVRPPTVVEIKGPT